MITGDEVLITGGSFKGMLGVVLRASEILSGWVIYVYGYGSFHLTDRQLVRR